MGSRRRLGFPDNWRVSCRTATDAIKRSLSKASVTPGRERAPTATEVSIGHPQRVFGERGSVCVIAGLERIPGLEGAPVSREHSLPSCCEVGPAARPALTSPRPF